MGVAAVARDAAPSRSVAPIALARPGAAAATPSTSRACSRATTCCPHQLLRRCIDHVLRTRGAAALGYAPREGLPRLRELIAEDLARQGVPARADDVLITTGSQQALDLVARALINPGDTFLVDEATYSGAINLLAAAGARVDRRPERRRGARPRSARAARARRRQGLLPDAQLPQPDRRVRLGARGARRWSPGRTAPACRSSRTTTAPTSTSTASRRPPALRALDGDVIYVGTFSKKLIPALRVGFIVCPRGAAHATCCRSSTRWTSAPRCCCSTRSPSSSSAATCARTSRRTVPEYRARRDALDAGARASTCPTDVELDAARERGLVLWLPLPAGIDPEAVVRGGAAAAACW